MSDDSGPAKRGRKPKVDRTNDVKAVVDVKKRPHKEVKSNNDVGAADNNGHDGVVAVKRGRGRPKGTTKKTKASAKPKSKGTGRRGRPKKEEPKESADEEEDDDNDVGEEEDDD